MANHINPNSATMGSNRQNLVSVLIINTYIIVYVFLVRAHLVHNEIKMCLFMVAEFGFISGDSPLW